MTTHLPPLAKQVQPGMESQDREHPGSVRAVNESNVEFARARLQRLRDVMRAHFVARDEAIDALLYGVLAHQPVLFIGRPGSGKTQLLNTFCALLGVNSNQISDAPRLFHYLLTEFTVPEELFGYPDLKYFTTEGVFRRDDSGMVQNADVVFLDEVFNASSANLNALLSLLQEHCFYDRGRRVEACFRVFVGATQHPPAHEDLVALYDRFTVRIATDWVDDTDQLDMLHRGLGQQDQVPLPVASLDDVNILIQAVQERLSVLYQELHGSNTAAIQHYLQLVRHLRSLGVMMSDRKIVNFCAVLAARAVLDGDNDLFSARGLSLLRFALSDPTDGTVLDLLQRALDLTSEAKEAS